jgi:glucokinase
MILGIDIGGTTVKTGVVTEEGDIIERGVFDTHSWDSSASLFISNLGEVINEIMQKHEINGIGIGLPGLLTKDRLSTVTLENIPVLNYYDFVVELQKKLTTVLPISIENDAKCAALGELFFGADKELDSYLMVTLGTGVGGGLVIDKKIFIGVNGNATEVGHIPIPMGRTLEECVGLEHLITYAKEKLKEPAYQDSILKSIEITPKSMFESALKGDKLSLHIFDYIGKCLAQMLVGVMRLLDLNTFVLGGGVSGAFEFIEPSIRKYLAKDINTYYMDNLKIIKASLSNDAGILGAASLSTPELPA